MSKLAPTYAEMVESGAIKVQPKRVFRAFVMGMVASISAPMFVLLTPLLWVLNALIEGFTKVESFGRAKSLGMERQAMLVIYPILGAVWSIGGSFTIYFLTDPSLSSMKFAGLKVAWWILIVITIYPLEMVWIIALGVAKHVSHESVDVFDPNVDAHEALEEITELRSKVSGTINSPARREAAMVWSEEALESAQGGVVRRVTPSAREIRHHLRRARASKEGNWNIPTSLSIGYCIFAVLEAIVITSIPSLSWAGFIVLAIQGLCYVLFRWAVVIDTQEMARNQLRLLVRAKDLEKTVCEVTPSIRDELARIVSQLENITALLNGLTARSPSGGLLSRGLSRVSRKGKLCPMIRRS